MLLYEVTRLVQEGRKAKAGSKETPMSDLMSKSARTEAELLIASLGQTGKVKSEPAHPS